MLTAAFRCTWLPMAPTGVRSALCVAFRAAGVGDSGQRRRKVPLRPQQPGHELHGDRYARRPSLFRLNHSSSD